MNPVLYLLMRNDLPSLNMGKGMAQSGHVTNEFVYRLKKMVKDENVDKKERNELKAMYDAWKEDRAFGTTITLAADKDFINVKLGYIPGTIHGLVYDPSYPCSIPKEAAEFLKTLVPIIKTETFNWPKTYPETSFDVHVGENGGTLLRSELVGAFFFGDKDNGKLMRMLEGLELYK